MNINLLKESFNTICMTIEVKEMQIKTSVDSKNAQSDEKASCDDLRKVKMEIVKECMEHVVEYLTRMEDR